MDNLEFCLCLDNPLGLGPKRQGDRALALIDHGIHVLHVEKVQTEPLNGHTDMLMQSGKVPKILLDSLLVVGVSRTLVPLTLCSGDINRKKTEAWVES